MWIASLSNALNSGGLPEGYFAMAEQPTAGVVPDVLTLELSTPRGPHSRPARPGGLALAEAPPRTRFVCRSEAEICAAKANRIAIHHDFGDVVAVIEIVSPGNKSGKAALRSFVDKAVDFLRRGIHLLVIDLFPPTPRDPQGIHKAIWDEIEEGPFALPPDKPLTLASYSAGLVKTAYIEPVAVGDVLPEMPLFLLPERYVPAPLEATYQATWDVCPGPLRDAVLAGKA
jgi:hypothetical protein